MVIRRLSIGLTVILGSSLLSFGASGSVVERTSALHQDLFVHVPKVTSSTFKGRGPYSVGEVTLAVPVPSEGYATSAEIWYPAKAIRSRSSTYNMGSWFPSPLLTLLKSKPALMSIATFPSSAVRNAASAPGRFPLVLFSHGWAGFRDQSTFLTSQLASWGFIVAAPDHPSRDLTEVVGSYIGIASPTNDPYADVQDLLATVRLLQGSVSGPLSHAVDASRFVVIGHSAGGVTAEELSSLETAQSTTSGENPDLGFIAMAGASTAGIAPPLPAPFNVLPSEPSIFVTAQQDAVVPGFFMRATYNVMSGQHRMITLAKSGHLVFSDTCATVPGTGVLVALLKGLAISLPAAFRLTASDGCHSPDLKVTKEWPVINQLTVAGVRWMFGIDQTTAGLDGLRSSFGSLVTVDTTGPAK